MKIRSVSVMVFIIISLILSSVFIPVSFADSSENEQDLPGSWFDDALFLGDSLTGSLASYCMINDGLGQAKILFMNGLGCRKIVNHEYEIGFMGKTYPVEKAIKAADAGKLFVMLAMNDIGYDIEELREVWNTFIDMVRDECPEIKVFIQSGTPVLKDNLYFTKKNMDEYNKMLIELCQERDCIYVDVTNGLADEYGYLKAEFKQEYVSDNVHMNFDGCKIWVDNLKTSANYSVQPIG